MFVPRSIAFVVGSACLAAAAALQVADKPVPSADKSPRELYVENCATCHGVSGDGKGIAVLERPARSFKDGGFSYGNTPEALLRTITHGIPGSLMPSFGEALNEEQRKALASYVITLGPPVMSVDAKDTIMVVRDRAVVVRGKLPPIVDGAPERPRGMLIGLPSGLSFEYRVDDVRLLGVRSGEFVDRTDWVGRGGTALQPLGKLVGVSTEGEPRPSFAIWDPEGPGMGLKARLVSTSVDGPRVTITYDLLGSEGVVVARVREIPEPFSSVLGSGWLRTFTFAWRVDPLSVRFDLGVNPFACHWSPPFVAHTIESSQRARTYDLTLLRDPRGVFGRSVRGSERLPHLLLQQAEEATWTVFSLPGVVLPFDREERDRAVIAFGKTLP